MAPLAGDAVRALHQVAVDDHPAAAAGAEDHGEAGVAPRPAPRPPRTGPGSWRRWPATPAAPAPVRGPRGTCWPFSQVELALRTTPVPGDTDPGRADAHAPVSAPPPPPTSSTRPRTDRPVRPHSAPGLGARRRDSDSPAGERAAPPRSWFRQSPRPPRSRRHPPASHGAVTRIRIRRIRKVNLNCKSRQRGGKLSGNRVGQRRRRWKR